MRARDRDRSSTRPRSARNLKDHYQARIIVQAQAPISLNDDVRNPLKLAADGGAGLLQRSGPLTVGAGQVGGLVACTRHARDGARTCCSTSCRCRSTSRATRCTASRASRRRRRSAGPASSGRLGLRSADPLVPVRIEPRYLSDPLDREVLVDGIRMLRDIYRQPAFRDFVDAEALPGADAQSDADLLEFARRHGGTVFHPVGTCRMGDDDTSVVDHRLRVRGVERLRIVDASVMPRSSRRNTNAAAIMIGEKGAALILEDEGGAPAPAVPARAASA